MISCLILTKNEEANLPSCLAALRWCDDIVVLDSGSTDRTVEIAERAGARVALRQWDSERNQREYSLGLPFKYPWIYNPDADEVTPTELMEEMQRAVSHGTPKYVAYRVRFRVFFMGKWVRRSSLYPTWVMRLFRPEKVSFERDTNLRYLVDGPVGRLQNHFEHHTFRRGLHHWFAKHNDYSSLEAIEALKVLRDSHFDFGRLVAVNHVERRRAWKELSFRIPARALATLLYLLFIRGGLLDGTAGLAYCGLRASYELMIELKINELLQSRHDSSVQ